MILEYKGIKPDIDESCYISENATVIGRVKMKKNANVWYGTVIRGDDNHITIGENTNIQDNCTVHINKNMPTVIGDYVTVGHNAIIHACHIGNYVLVGMGAIVLDGAEIGDHVIIGSGSLVPPGKKIPSNSLVMGSPAKIVRELTEEDRKQLESSALNYVEMANNHRK
ncbi:Carbonic anhydrase or acetyltransferase, isoleucine patch superfamily [Geosporobacter subterraneus DSM 17957]|uniref:Carbonic anhydrase or acetyltransferase, isoleucine patch superfamily n=1 Tax=Geosporobacter subterraneus DSM 17957 TaxID=1121919 RepID=A0A1M6BRU2_9FIRM|nr:gamma carbonic anhydrase family protein [Geosporobacter subterraneus]SHI51475.1 Carbonic anhydrase or acetyltransferase, isoleucine patch superfamily [Geosporobacter subterraneus DSM 17957]